jgi:hypothetical protein
LRLRYPWHLQDQDRYKNCKCKIQMSSFHRNPQQCSSVFDLLDFIDSVFASLAIFSVRIFECRIN